jgi:hypothetical protein
MHFESPQRELVVSGYKNDMRALGVRDVANDIEA